jgi:peptidylprolyl isomerase
MKAIFSKISGLGLLSALLAGTTAFAADAPPAVKYPPSPQEILEAAPADAWVSYAPEDLVVMTLADKSEVVYALAKAFAPVHVDNIRKLIRQGWFDGAAVIRVQDGFVVQWGRADEAEDDKPGKKPEGIITPPPAEYDQPTKGLAITPLKYADTYAARVGFVKSWPVASDGAATWLTHCYGMIGVARSMAPDTGSGTQLYTVIGQAPRRLDRNLTVVARIVSGMENLSNRARGTGPLGFYKTPEENTAIVSAKLMSDLPETARKSYQVLSTETPTFMTWVTAKATAPNAFYLKPAGAIDLCNALPPVRPKPLARP